MNSNYFDEMLEYIQINTISLEKFNNYFMKLFVAIKNDYLKEPIKYLMGLYDSKVICNGSDEEKYYKFLIEIIKQFIARLNRSTITSTDESRISLYLSRIELLSTNFNKLSVTTYVDYCELLKLMYEFDIAGVDYEKLTKSLLHVYVNVRTLDDREIVDIYKRELSILLLDISKRTLK